jgi:DNA invertase Pin-like site-specific DNA recombinase
MRYGYARVSSTGQSLDIQHTDLARFCDELRSEKQSGTSMDGRDELKRLLRDLRPGDEVYCVRLDRLARSLRDLMDIADTIRAAGASLHVTQQSIETKTPAGRLFFAILGAIAAFETELRKERQLEGIAAAKARGAYTRQGTRAPRYDRSQMLAMALRGLTAPEIAKMVGCAPYTVRRALRALHEH